MGVAWNGSLDLPSFPFDSSGTLLDLRYVIISLAVKLGPDDWIRSSEGELSASDEWLGDFDNGPCDSSALDQRVKRTFGCLCDSLSCSDLVESDIVPLSSSC